MSKIIMPIVWIVVMILCEALNWNSFTTAQGKGDTFGMVFACVVATGCLIAIVFNSRDVYKVIKELKKQQPMKYLKSEFDSLISNEHPEHIWRKLIKDFSVPVSFISHDITVAVLFRANRNHLGQGTEKLLKWAWIMSPWDNAKKEAFLGLTRDVMDTMIQRVISSEEYLQYFNNIDLQKVMPLEQMNIPSGDVYKQQNIGKDYVSLDLKEAAFQAFSWWDKYHKQAGGILPEGCDSYTDWVRYTVRHLEPEEPMKAQIIDEVEELLVEYLSDSKQMRQVIFGKTNPKRIKHVEKYIIQQAVKKIQDNSGLVPVCLNNDEAIYEADFMTDKFSFAKFAHQMNNCWRITGFRLKAYQMVQDAYILYERHKFNGPVVYVKSDPYEYDKAGWVNKSAKFKCLPNRFALAFEAMYNSDLNKESTSRLLESTEAQDAEFFLNLPVIDGVANWVMCGSGANTRWSIEEVKNEHV